MLLQNSSELQLIELQTSQGGHTTHESGQFSAEWFWQNVTVPFPATAGFVSAGPVQPSMRNGIKANSITRMQLRSILVSPPG
jgi:hypothetical protein